MKVVVGDLIVLAKQGKFDVICHGSNCFNTMGNGIAKQIKAEFPLAYEADCNTKKGDRSKLGNYSYATHAADNGSFLYIVNAYTQYQFWGKGPNVDYEAIRLVFSKIAHDFNGLRIGYPKIGAGLACGNWEIISKIIDQELSGQDHTLVELC